MSNDNNNKVNEDELSRMINKLTHLENSMLCKSSSSDIDLITNCDSLKRLTLGLNIYQLLRNDTKSKPSLSLFLNETYKINQFIDDIKHFKVEHATHNKQLYQIKKEILSSKQLKFKKCTLDKCKYTHRHFQREKKEINNQNNQETDNFIKFYCLKMDNIHFNIFHLFESGFRCIINDDIKKQSEDDINIDKEYLAISHFNGNKREQFNRFKSANNKYNICTTANKPTLEKKGDTFCDSLFDFMYNNNNDNDNNNNIDKIIQFIFEERFDSDSIKEDFEDCFYYFGHEKQAIPQSNFYQQFRNQSAFEAMQTFMNLFKS